MMDVLFVAVNRRDLRWPNWLRNHVKFCRGNGSLALPSTACCCLEGHMQKKRVLSQVWCSEQSGIEFKSPLLPWKLPQ